MGTPVEAQSLSSLNRLLSNPPQYPRNPTHEVQRPLVLYIVRVPGSKDIFLTPLKPPTKASISLEAIQSSLYYLHVNTPEDEEIRQSLDERNHASKPENIAPQVMRKPLPSVPQAVYTPTELAPQFGLGHEFPPAGHDVQNRESKFTAQMPGVGLSRASSEHSGRNQPVRRKPVQSGNIQLPTGYSTQEYHSSQIHDSSQNDWGKQASELINQVRMNDHSTLPRLSTSTTQTSNNGSYSPIALAPSRSNRWSQPPPRSSPDMQWAPSPTRNVQAISMHKEVRPPAAITLIRRDPVSGAQWNIGTISQLDSNTFDSTLKPVSIELETPGYSKFTRQLEFPRPGSSKSTASSIKHFMASGEFQDLQLDRDGLPTFMRTVEFRRQPLENRPSLQNRTNSLESVPNFPIQNKPPRSVLSFNSPWQGFCAFSNGIDGKSLKCRHTLPSTNYQEESVVANVAELRFNLPWSVLGQRDPNKKPTYAEAHSETDTLPIVALLKEPRSGKEAWRRSVQHLRNISKDVNKRDRFGIENAYAANAGHTTANTTNSSSSSTVHLPSSTPSNAGKGEQGPDPRRLSLKLGREKAGGGFKGNSAKLGKLIIEDEGLKMGDLVVAACMSIWWQHYAGGVGQ